MLKIYHFNHIKTMVKSISKILAINKQSNPLEQETIIIQNSNISQWLQIELAYNIGIAANITYLPLKNFFWDIFKKIKNPSLQNKLLSKRVIVWKLMSMLPSLLHIPEFKSVKSYLNNDINQNKLHQLSIYITDLFYKYSIYRSNLTNNWSKKKINDNFNYKEKWQKILWHLLMQNIKKHNCIKWHFLNFHDKLKSYLQENPKLNIKLPKRIFICGINILPPLYLEIIEHISKHINIYFFFHNPSYDYFYNSIEIKKKIHFDIYKKKVINKEINQKITNNALLLSWDKLRINTLYYILKCKHTKHIKKFTKLQNNSLLQNIQNNILNFKNYNIHNLKKKIYKNNISKEIIKKNDKSITFHACHSPQREIEVLYDYILSLFEKYPILQPKDIIVMAPDINEYSSYIAGIFNDINSNKKIPFFISNKNKKQFHPIINAFITLLNLSHSRCTLEELLNLLELPSISEKFFIEQKDFLLLKYWLTESGIRWGLNNEHIKKIKLPIIKHNTWTFGLNRMFLGYMMNNELGIWDKILPYDISSFSSIKLINSVNNFITQIINLKKKIYNPKTLLNWEPICNYILNNFFKSDEQTDIITTYIYKKWQNIISNGYLAKNKNKIPLSIIYNELILDFNNDKNNKTIINGSLIFCNIDSMNGIPFKIVCLLGMNDTAYPRTEHKYSIDLMNQKSKCGDINVKDHDSYLFLEILNSALDKFYISYIANDIANNKSYNPTIFINELIEFIDNNFYLENDNNKYTKTYKNIKKHLLTYHTRTNFNIENYIENNIHQSYDARWLININSSLSSISKKNIFYHNQLSIVNNDFNINNINIDDLIYFYQHPIRMFFQKTLNTKFLIKNITSLNDEPFILNKLEEYKINKIILNTMINNESLNNLLKRLIASGTLPSKQFGKIYFENQINKLKPLFNKIITYKKKSFNKILYNKFNNFYLIGNLKHIQKNGIIRYHPSKISINNIISLWIEHLIFSITIYPCKSHVLGLDNQEWSFQEIDKDIAIKNLQILITGYQKGMYTPLPLFNKSSWKWLNILYSSKNKKINHDVTELKKIANKELIKSLQGTYNQNGEINDIYNARIFTNINNDLIKKIKKNAYTYLYPMLLYQINYKK